MTPQTPGFVGSAVGEQTDALARVVSRSAEVPAAPDVEVAFLDTAGVIVSVNRAWDDFCRLNGGEPGRAGVGVSYLAVCAAAGDDPAAGQVADAVRSAIRGDLPVPVRLLIPCFGAGGTGWFDLVVYSRFDAEARCTGAGVALSPVPVGSGDLIVRDAPGVVPVVSGLDPARAVDLTGRVNDVVGERDSLTGLLTVTRSLATHLDVSQVLEEILVAARDVVGADYAALGVLGADGKRLAQFVHSGITPELVAQVGALPTGHGILGRLIDDPRPLRIADLHAHPASAGFPKHHPAMTSFLGVPIRIRDTVFGNIYLTNKRGGGEFTEQDEQVLVSLAATAAIAIDNARLYQDIAARNRWREASIRVTNGILADPSSPNLPCLIAAEARQLADADNLALGTTLPGGHSVTVVTCAGQEGQHLIGVVHPLAGSILEAVNRDGSFVSADAAADDRIPRFRAYLPDAGPVIAVPMTLSETTAGFLTATRDHGRAPFAAADEVMLTHFARQAALALELAKARAAAERAKVLDERQRIARDIHDNVLGRLFGTGMVLQRLIRTTSDPAAGEVLESLTVEIETAINDLRSTLYAPDSDHTGSAAHPASPAVPTGLGAQVAAVIHDSVAQLGFIPTTVIDDGIDVALGPEAGHHLVAVLREALTNIARHADATTAHLTITTGTGIELTISDNGGGLPDHSPAPTTASGHGLANMADRAHRLGGSFRAESHAGGGTTLRWTVPTDHTRR